MNGWILRRPSRRCISQVQRQQQRPTWRCWGCDSHTFGHDAGGGVTAGIRVQVLSPLFSYFVFSLVFQTTTELFKAMQIDSISYCSVLCQRKMCNTSPLPVQVLQILVISTVLVLARTRATNTCTRTQELSTRTNARTTSTRTLKYILETNLPSIALPPGVSGHNAFTPIEIHREFWPKNWNPCQKPDKV